MLKSNDEVRAKAANNANETGLQSITNMLANDNMPAHVYKDKKNGQQPPNSTKSEGLVFHIIMLLFLNIGIYTTVTA